MNTDLMFSSATDQWATPQAFFDSWDATYRFELDVCADAQNAKCWRYFSVQDNGLYQDWAPNRCWMNPPYGREIGRWMRKAYEESLKGATVVCLVPARTDTAWWHDYAMKGEITFIRGRLRFGEAKSGAPFPSAVVVFSPPEAL
jgi:phage N-6-adenine-methyltransferase